MDSYLKELQIHLTNVRKTYISERAKFWERKELKKSTMKLRHMHKAPAEDLEKAISFIENIDPESWDDKTCSDGNYRRGFFMYSEDNCLTHEYKKWKFYPVKTFYVSEHDHPWQVFHNGNENNNAYFDHSQHEREVKYQDRLKKQIRNQK